MSRLRRTWLVVPLAVALALAAGALVTFLQSPTYEARAAIDVTRGNKFVGAHDVVAPALEAMLEGDIVAANTVSTLRLDESPGELRRRLHVDTDAKTLLLRLRVEDGSARRARAIAAEVVAVFVQQVRSRFGSSGLKAAVLDAPHLEGKVSPRPARDLAISAAAGLAVGAASLLLLRGGAGRRRHAVEIEDEERRNRELQQLRERLADVERERDDAVRRADAVSRHEVEEHAARAAALAEREDGLTQRVEAVTRRELALARRVGPLGARERELDERERGLAEREGKVADRAEQVADREERLAERLRGLDEREGRLDEEHRRLEQEEEAAASARAAAPEPAPRPAIFAGTGAFTLDELARLVEARRDEFPGRADEWHDYLFFLREHADVDGRLPSSFDDLVGDVFADVLA